MDYLALCRKTWQACGLSGEGPVDVRKAVSMHARVCEWVDEAYIHIQQLHYNWSFLWAVEDGTLQAGKLLHTLKDLGREDFGWLLKISLQSGTQPLPLAYHHKFDPLTFGLETGQPTGFTIRPDGVWVFDPHPDKEYKVNMEYFRQPQHLVENTDVPLIPDDFQHMIVAKAKMLYALYDESATDLQDAALKYGVALPRAEVKFLPSIQFSRSPF